MHYAAIFEIPFPQTPLVAGASSQLLLQLRLNNNIAVPCPGGCCLVAMVGG
jgi:hypothetical protein